MSAPRSGSISWGAGRGGVFRGRGSGTDAVLVRRSFLGAGAGQWAPGWVMHATIPAIPAPPCVSCVPCKATWARPYSPFAANPPVEAAASASARSLARCSAARCSISCRGTPFSSSSSRSSITDISTWNREGRGRGGQARTLDSLRLSRHCPPERRCPTLDSGRAGCVAGQYGAGSAGWRGQPLQCSTCLGTVGAGGCCRGVGRGCTHGQASCSPCPHCGLCPGVFCSQPPMDPLPHRAGGVGWRKIPGVCDNLANTARHCTTLRWPQPHAPLPHSIPMQ